MMDLIFEYLIVYILIFATNIAFLMRYSRFNKNKFVPFTLGYAILVFLLSFVFSSLNLQESAIYFIPYALFIFCIFMLIFSIRYVSLGRNYGILDDKLVLYGTVLSSFLSIVALSLCLKSDNLFLSCLELAILSAIVIFLVYKISKIFNNAKRPYYAVIGEYMFLEFILLLILALTFFSVRDLDYSMFGSFLILTPTYKVLYMILVIVIMLVLGVLYNDCVLKRLKRK